MAKYNPVGVISFAERTWPQNRITHAPVWCSVDLRDGNQALAVPMNVEKKLAFFDMLVEIGFKEIEVGFPSASQTEYDFIRRLIDERHIPDLVTIQVLCQAREPLICRTLESIRGAPSAIFHLYNSTSPAQRKYTFNMTKDEIRELAVEGVHLLRKNLHLAGNTPVRLEYSPESFSSTEPEFALAICEDVKAAWNASSGNKIILNLPETVEYATPNVYADQIEYFCRNISDRASVIVSLHTHNDRGTGVAAAELGLLAGADRVEGTLFGNGERTGNLDLVTLSMNLFVQGIKTGLDFSSIDAVKEHFTQLTSMEVYRRQPYAGDLVYTAFSGSHQDAIRKALYARTQMPPDAPWDVPYLLIDPKDVGREYEEIIRINSQSGKSGAAWILETEYGIFMPKKMQLLLGTLVTRQADILQRELKPAEIYRLFKDSWFNKRGPLELLDIAETHVNDSDTRDTVLCRASIRFLEKVYSIGDKGNGPLDAFVSSLRNTPVPVFTIGEFQEHSIGAGSDTDAMAYIQITCEDGRTAWGCARSSNIGRAGINAAVSAVNNLFGEQFPQ
ncbi:MAG: 2-isopropylmalate synthase [Bacteroides sp.]|nr:2-isopropylmalate synthase [Prevotella sp.]MCM1407108.1 2-isopropylmalate synthase [Treponema brennaborense]MCM1470260.1 2-isopropylmalate synthase [Bacteroides sp.]